MHPFEIKYTDGQQKHYEPMRIPVALPHVGLQTEVNNQLEQKEFILSLVEIMQEQAIVMEYRQLRSAHEHTNTPSPANKRQRINPSKPHLPIERLEPPWMPTSILFQRPEALVSTAAF